MSKNAKIEPIHREESARLKALYKERVSKSQADFGADAGIGTQGMVWQYLNARAPLNLDAAIKFARALSVSVRQFSPRLADALPNDLPSSETDLAGEAPRDIAHEHTGKYGQILLSSNGLCVDPITHSGITHQHALDVPVMPRVVAVESGDDQPESMTVLDHLRLSDEWVSKNLPKISSPQNLAVLSAYGSAMEPTFRDGDLLLVDRGVTEARLPAVYVIERDGQLQVVRLQPRVSSRAVALKWDNPLYDSEEFASPDRIDVRGKVVFAWNGTRL